MKKTLTCLALILSGAVHADDLANANQMLVNQAYPQALALYEKLAAAGNPAAQFSLGEMYWYGEAGKIDVEQARSWFTKAAAAGNLPAVAALDTMRQRELHRADIAFWVSAYDGSDMKTGKFACERPAFPLSRTNADIKKVQDGYLAWQQCYNGFVENVNSALPPGKRIPVEISKLMNQIEFDQSVSHLDRVYAGLTSDAAKSAQSISVDYKDWHESTIAYVAQQNAATTIVGNQDVLELQQARLEGNARKQDVRDMLNRPTTTR